MLVGKSRGQLLIALERMKQLRKSGNGALSSCLFNLYAESIMGNAGLDESQAGIKIPGRNINNLRYANGTTLMAESEEEVKSLLISMKEESEKAGLKLNLVQKTRTMTSICHEMVPQ